MRPAKRRGARGSLARSIAWLLCTLVPASGGVAHAADQVRLDAVVPSQADSILLCTLRTRGLPDGPSRETLRSGLPSALVVAFTLLDRSGREVGGSRVEIRIEPDLWEDLLVLRTPLLDLRLASIDELAEQLAELGPLPVLPLIRVPVQESLRVRARLAVYPLAPAEIRKVRALFGGEEGNDPDRREVSIGIGSLIRYFLGGRPEEDWVAEAVSQPFVVSAPAARQP